MLCGCNEKYSQFTQLVAVSQFGALKEGEFGAARASDVSISISQTMSNTTTNSLNEYVQLINCIPRSFIERAPDIYFYSTLVAHLLELIWSIASAAVASAMVYECPAETMIPISLIGN